jgi:formylglycine-generating enzyme required for sulfatase activity/dienelactone hydrolase
MIGETVSHYRITALLGAGGMGVVYRAEDLRLQRQVALKFLPFELTQDHDARQRLVQEARAASALDHPNICTVHEIDETPDGRVFVAMAYYEGETLKQRIARGPLPMAEAVDVATQLARAVAAAHEAGILHRDLKPANVVVTTRGQVKLLDFGVAKLLGQTGLTRTGETVGTVAYMAPEQITGAVADERTDVWALGVVLYEMLAGRLPFGGEHALSVINAIANTAPVSVVQCRPEVSAQLAGIVGKAMEKASGSRYASAREMLHDLERCAAGTPAEASRVQAPSPVPPATGRFRKPRVIAAALVALVAISAAGAWWAQRLSRARWARQQMAEVARLAEQEQFASAYRLLRRIEPVLAADPELESLKKNLLWPFSVTTTPPGASLFVKGYGEVNEEWLPLGTSPLTDARGPLGYYRWRVTKPGFTTFEGAEDVGMADLSFVLLPEGAQPEGLVRVPGGTVTLPGGTSASLPDFFIDRYEVTNREYMRFVSAGGYARPEFWQEPFVEGGRVLARGEAMGRLVDATGRPGPATWELGTYPEGQDDFPVRGVSWYEAAAYARFAGKRVPTVHHWQRAAAFGINSDVLEHSNFAGKGPARVGAYPGIGAYGTYDLAGNVREWCWNALDERRYILGGAWNEPVYMYREPSMLGPFDRSPSNGIRTVKDAVGTPPVEALLGPMPQLQRDYSKETPVSDEVFKAYSGLYSYDPSPLDEKVESTDDTAEHWRVERVSYAAAYGQERITGYLFLPRRMAPPYQAVVYFPHSGGTIMKSFEQSEMQFLGFIVKAGRALLLPMYKGTYERRLPPGPLGPSARRDLVVQQMKDLRRSVDFLESRQDIDRARLAYFGVSMGARLAGIALAVEPRFDVAVLWSGGFRSSTPLPEIDEINYAPRVKTPLLMLNGRDDHTFPVNSSQLPMFRWLGTPEADKRHVLYDGGHVFPFARIMKDTLDWLDRYLGPPRPASAEGT